MRWFFFPSIHRFPDDRPQTALLLPLFFPALRSAPSPFRKIPEASLRGHVRNLFPTAQSAVFLHLPVQLTHHFLSENALFYSPFLKREVTEKFAFPCLSLYSYIPMLMQQQLRSHLLRVQLLSSRFRRILLLSVRYVRLLRILSLHRRL